ncbi:PREDICTED: uncharacterized protein LOC109126410 [Camelina sativa]|uniref:Uncharacterized protein LOC109126410 n=1 Tax=Camelina sativa TaxID=90675 RepID=A0ABM1QFF1_CAMSA|nr:PREDICTED: uncharacterized protein LOC109126410 [Camelina sativa]
MEIIENYRKASGQEVNLAKSSIMFGKSVLSDIRTQLKYVIGISTEGGMGSYLGIPENLHGSRTKVFSYVNDRLDDRVNGWSAKYLSKGGKEELTSKLTSAIARFWWKSNDKAQGLHWVAWDKMCKGKCEGGERVVIGSGCNTYVWRDPWIPDNPPRPATGRGKVLHPNLMVNHLINPITRECHLPILEEFMDPEEIPIILSLTVSKSFKPDRLIWHFTKTGKYSVKSGYRLARDLIKEVEYESTCADLRAQAWKLEVPPKIQHFFWHIAFGSLPVMERLAHRGTTRDGFCLYCFFELLVQILLVLEYDDFHEPFDPNVTDLINGIGNIKILQLTSSAVEVKGVRDLPLALPETENLLDGFRDPDFHALVTSHFPKWPCGRARIETDPGGRT